MYPTKPISTAHIMDRATISPINRPVSYCSYSYIMGVMHWFVLFSYRPMMQLVQAPWALQAKHPLVWGVDPHPKQAPDASFV